MIKALLIIPSVSLLLAAAPSSNTYQINNYSVGSGGSNTSSSATYTLQGSAGEISGAPSSSSNYTVKSGSIQAEQANVPAAPTLSNGSNSYTNKLNFIINTSGNPSDAKYSVAVSTNSNFTTTNYVQSDGTLGTSPVYQTYAQWGGATGMAAIGLGSNTAYWFKVNTSQGKFTNSAYGPSATASTVGGPTVSFSINPGSLNIIMDDLLPNTVAPALGDMVFNFSTTAANGGSIYMAGQYTGLRSAATTHTIQVSPPSGNLATLNEGFGVQTIFADAPLVAQPPYNGGGNVVGAIYTTFQPLFTANAPVTNGTASATFLAKASTTTPSARDYQDILTLIAAAVS